MAVAPAAGHQLHPDEVAAILSAFDGILEGTVTHDSTRAEPPDAELVRYVGFPIRGCDRAIAVLIEYNNTKQDDPGGDWLVSQMRYLTVASSVETIFGEEFPDAHQWLGTSELMDTYATAKEARRALQGEAARPLTSLLEDATDLVDRGQFVDNAMFREAVMCARLGIDSDNRQAIEMLDNEKWLDYRVDDPQVRLALAVGRNC